MPIDQLRAHSHVGISGESNRNTRSSEGSGYTDCLTTTVQCIHVHVRVVYMYSVNYYRETRESYMYNMSSSFAFL